MSFLLWILYSFSRETTMQEAYRTHRTTVLAFSWPVEDGGGEREGYPCPGHGEWVHVPVWGTTPPPVDRHTPVKTLPSRRTTYAIGKYVDADQRDARARSE